MRRKDILRIAEECRRDSSSLIQSIEFGIRLQCGLVYFSKRLNDYITLHAKTGMELELQELIRSRYGISPEF
jgi:hypothetical protein